MIVLCGNLTIPYCGRFFHCFYLEERKNCATALAGHRAAILFNRNLWRDASCTDYDCCRDFVCRLQISILKAKERSLILRIPF